MAMDYIRTTSLRGNAEDAEALVYWLNTLPVPSALLVSELADLQDGRVIVDVVTHLFGSAGKEVLGMDLTQALERLDVLGGAPQQFPASSILAGQRPALLWVVDTLRGCAEAAASHSDSGGGNEVELEAVRAMVQLIDGSNDRAAAVRVEVGQRRGGSTSFEGSRGRGGGGGNTVSIAKPTPEAAVRQEDEHRRALRTERTQRKERRRRQHSARNLARPTDLPQASGPPPPTCTALALRAGGGGSTNERRHHDSLWRRAPSPGVGWNPSTQLEWVGWQGKHSLPKPQPQAPTTARAGLSRGQADTHATRRATHWETLGEVTESGLVVGGMCDPAIRTTTMRPPPEMSAPDGVSGRGGVPGRARRGRGGGGRGSGTVGPAPAVCRLARGDDRASVDATGTRQPQRGRGERARSASAAAMVPSEPSDRPSPQPTAPRATGPLSSALSAPHAAINIECAQRVVRWLRTVPLVAVRGPEMLLPSAPLTGTIGHDAATAAWLASASEVLGGGEMLCHLVNELEDTRACTRSWHSGSRNLRVGVNKAMELLRARRRPAVAARHLWDADAIVGNDVVVSLELLDDMRRAYCGVLGKPVHISGVCDPPKKLPHGPHDGVSGHKRDPLKQVSIN
eukprot:COSAG01_NODE_2241_length_8086_cov_25.173282_5_plen_625_part_00